MQILPQGGDGWLWILISCPLVIVIPKHNANNNYKNYIKVYSWKHELINQISPIFPQELETGFLYNLYVHKNPTMGNN